MPLSINLSAHDLLSNEIIDQIIEQVKDSGVSPELLEFEVTETAMMADMQKASDNMMRLAELGHPMALDDFGTGYSNFNYLRKLPINKLKVDRSFMENLTDPMTEKSCIPCPAWQERSMSTACWKGLKMNWNW